jgi:hypothetical protein
MRDYGTLESPFTREYLLELLSVHDFHVVGDFVTVNGLFEREAVMDGHLPIAPPAVNYLLCKKLERRADGAPVHDSREPNLLRAMIELCGEWREEVAPSASVRATIKITNTGDTLWLVGSVLRKGIVTLGTKLINEAGDVVDECHNDPLLPCAIAPGESAILTLNHAAPIAPGRYTLKIDLIDQHICWFEERGSRPLIVPFFVRES